jgi:cell division protein FtsI/penicillin-binding protein 2
MFRKRLTAFGMILGVIAVAIVARLAQIQMAQAAEYRLLAERILTRPVRYLPAPRGSILDRQGRPLLSDEPSADVCVHYAVLTGDGDYLRQLAGRLRRRGDFPDSLSTAEIVDELRARIQQMWQRLSELAGVPVSDFIARANAIRARVARIREQVQANSPTVRRIQEEDRYLPVIERVTPELALAVRLELSHYPWLRVVPGSWRVAHNADAVAHLLGRQGEASAERIATDPLRGDELRQLRPGDRCGVSGVERLADTSLRGWAGRVSEDIGGGELQRIPPRAGNDVHLTLDLALQQYVLALLTDAVTNMKVESHEAGGAAVVIDVATREVLALASYPSYDYENYNRDYDELRRDVTRMPLLFRPVQGRYAPGSICKGITLIGGLTEGVITPETRFHCTGHLLPDKPDRFRCWIYNQHAGLTHDMIDDPAGENGENAVKNSCNIYFFQVGQRLGPERLCDWFRRFGLGRTQGTGLIEETPANVPTEDWLQATQKRTFQPADAWNLAIGQGEITLTPLQAANVGATIASGYWAPVRLAYDTTGRALGDPPTADQPFDDRHLQVLRRGMWRVVNDPHGTGRTARLDRTDYEFCGKTGSAQAVPFVIATRYICEWPDGRREEVIALSEAEALAQFGADKPQVIGRRVAERYPELGEDGKLPSHAWFMGFTQPAGTRRGAAPKGPVYAIAVVIEFGGSGGQVAAPVAKSIAEYLLAQYGE